MRGFLAVFLFVQIPTDGSDALGKKKRKSANRSQNTSQVLDLDEKLAEYWLSFQLGQETETEIRQNLERIRLRRRELESVEEGLLRPGKAGNHV